MEHNAPRDSRGPSGYSRPTYHSIPDPSPRAPLSWIKEIGTGRSYCIWVNKYGEKELRYSDEPDGGTIPWADLELDAPRSGSTTRSSHKSLSKYTVDDLSEQSSRGKLPMSKSSYDSESHNDSRALQKSPELSYLAAGKRERDRETVAKTTFKTSHSDGYKSKTSENNPHQLPSGKPAIKDHQIYGTGDDVKLPSSSYSVRNWHMFFQPGRVFSVRWTDDSDGPPKKSENSQRITPAIVQFVVVMCDDTSCTCLPVTTSYGRGPSKRGANLHEQGLIFSSEKPPTEDQGVGKPPIRVLLSEEAEGLLSPSFINYGAKFTVQKDVKVKDIGQLDSKSREQLRIYYNQVKNARSNKVKVLPLKNPPEIPANPDLVKIVLQKIWPSSELKTSLVSIEYKLKWDILSFMRTYYPAEQNLGNVLTLTGDIFDAQAVSCQEYLKMIWPEHEVLLSKLLHAIESLIQGHNSAIVKNDRAGMFWNIGKTTQKDSDAEVSVSVKADYEIHGVLLSALSWLCAAIRYSPFTEVVHSSVTVEGGFGNDSNYVNLSLNDLEKTQVRQACWHELFPHGVVAKGFPIRDRQQGKGLEISFANMALMSRSTSFVEFSDGLIGQGLQSLLIPIKYLRGDDALQWHYASKKGKHSRKQGRLAGILKENNVNEWYKELRSYKLIESRCFLGWSEEVSIVVGTEAYLNGSLRWSGIERCSTSLFAKSENISIDSQGLQYNRGNSSSFHVATAAPSFLNHVINKDILDYLDDEQDTDILVYDTGSKTATFLPHACITLLLVRKIVERRQYQLFDGRDPAALSYTEPSEDDAQESIAVLAESLSLKVRKTHARRNAPLDDFSILVRQVLEMIETVRCGMESAESHLVTTESGTLTQGILYGVELMDMVQMSRRLRIKDAAINQAWTYLGGHHSTVLFCKGLGQPIVCAQAENQCSSWAKVPAGMNFLVMTARTVLHLLEQYADEEGNSRFGRHLEWIFPEDSIHAHGPSVNGVTHVQHMKIVQNSKYQSRICERLLRYKNSGFIFSDASRPLTFCYEPTLAAIATAELDQATESALVPALPFDVLDGTSDSSTNSDRGSIGEERAADSMSSQDAQDNILSNPSQPQIHVREQIRQVPSSLPQAGMAIDQHEDSIHVPRAKTDQTKHDTWRRPQWLSREKIS